MIRDAARSGIVLAGGGYRSRGAQIALRRKHCGRSTYDTFLKPPSRCSPPTALALSNAHELGLAVDFVVDGKLVTANSPAYMWLAKNASRYSFIVQSNEEPWHWEFVTSRKTVATGSVSPT
jgi:zinc D-Ala-D-Ala carboxypeptidase